MIGSQSTIRVLVTGASGFLGRHLVERLNAEDTFSVFPVARHNMTPVDSNRMGVDITDFGDIGQLFDRVKPHCVVHLAALTGVRRCSQNPLLAIQTNVLGTFNIAWMSALHNSHLLFASSREVYGDVYVMRTGEEAPLRPKNLYGLTKLLGESIIKYLGSAMMLRYHVLRMTNLYGPGGYRDVVADIVRMALGASQVTISGGDQLINLLDVRDAAKAICACLRESKTAVYNIGSKDTIRVKELAELVIRLAESKAKIVILPARTDDTQCFVPDLSRIEADLGFEPGHGLHATLRELIQRQRCDTPSRGILGNG